MVRRRGAGASYRAFKMKQNPHRGNKLLTLLDGSFKAEPVKELKNGKYAYRLKVKKNYIFKEVPGVWKINSTYRPDIGVGIYYTFLKVK